VKYSRYSAGLRAGRAGF